MYFKLAIRNAKRSAGDYLLYMMTMAILTAVMMVSMCIAAAGKMQAGFQTASLPLLIFMILVILSQFIHRFMLARRSREFACYILLGMEKNKLTAMYLGELFLIGLTCFILGVIVGGFVFFILCVLGLVPVWDMGMLPGWVLDSLGRTLIFFVLLELVTMIPIGESLRHLEIDELMKGKKRGRGSLKIHSTGLWGTVAGVGIICFLGMAWGIAFQAAEEAFFLISFISIPLLVFVTAFYIWLYSLIGSLRERKSKLVYRHSRLYTASLFTSKTGAGAAMNSVLCLCLIFSACALGAGMVMLTPQLKIFELSSQSFMGSLQICLSIVFLVLYFCILSLYRLTGFRQETEDIRILSYLGRDTRQIKRLIRIQTALSLFLPALGCVILLPAAVILFNYKLNLLWQDTARDVIARAGCWFVFCFLCLSSCYFVVLYSAGLRYVLKEQKTVL